MPYCMFILKMKKTLSFFVIIILIFVIFFWQRYIRHKQIVTIVENNESRQLTAEEIKKIQHSSSDMSIETPRPVPAAVGSPNFQKTMDTLNKVQKINQLNKKQSK